MSSNLVFPLCVLIVDKNFCLNTSFEDEYWLLHMRLGHVNFDSHSMLAKKER